MADLDRYFDIPEVECILCIARDYVTVVTIERQYDDALMDRLIETEMTFGEYLDIHYTPKVFLEGWIFPSDDESE